MITALFVTIAALATPFDDAVAKFKGIPSYRRGDPFVLADTSGAWYSDDARALRNEIVRTCGVWWLDVAHTMRTEPIPKWVPIVREMTARGVSIVLRVDTLGGFERFKPIEAIDPRYQHQPSGRSAESYLSVAGKKKTYPSRYTYCPNRLASRLNIPLHGRLGVAMRSWGIPLKSVACVLDDSEVAYIPRGVAHAVDPALYADCKHCDGERHVADSILRVRQLCLDRLHVRWGGDRRKHFPHTFWSGAWLINTNTGKLTPSPWVSVERPLPVPQAAINLAWYGTKPYDVPKLIRTNRNRFTRPVLVWLGLNDPVELVRVKARQVLAIPGAMVGVHPVYGWRPGEAALFTRRIERLVAALSVARGL